MVLVVVEVVLVLVEVVLVVVDVVLVDVEVVLVVVEVVLVVVEVVLVVVNLCRRLASNLALGICSEAAINHSIRDLVINLARMSRSVLTVFCACSHAVTDG